jgi:DNA-nicking Smr family endonuclease
MAPDKKGRPGGFNSPFAGAAQRLAAVARRAEEQARLRAAAEADARAAPPPSPIGPSPGEEELWADELAGVRPIARDPGGRVLLPAAALSPARSRRQSDEAEAYAQLADLIEGSGPFSMSDSDEYLEFLAPGIDRRLLRKLRRGEYALQGHVDLHGQNRAEARQTVEGFIGHSRRAGHRCVLIIHGRGLNSKDQIPVLKERVKGWLERGRLGREVLAFVTARPCDGGAGALYVLLRR